MATIMKEIRRGYVLPLDGAHGVIHWARVLENGLRLAELTGADQQVVTLFALFHDCRRINEYHDKDHGLRGGEFARSLRGSLVHLNDQQFELLYEACRLHTDGRTKGDPTVLTCWDADRLDLGRVGIRPRCELLCTNAATGLMEWAHERAVRDYVPVETLTAWGVEM